MQAPAVNPWAMPIGSTMVMGVIIGVAMWQRRQRKLRRERPPNTRKLLRPPGHTLSVQLENCQEKLVESLVVAAGAGAMAALLLANLLPVLFSREARAWIASNGLERTLLSRQLFPALVGDVFLFVGCICAAGWGVLRCLKLMKEAGFLHLGLRGEQAVAEALAEAAGLGYRSFHDFPGSENWNIDHVVVGPGGVFAIETKTRSKRKAPPGMKDQEVLYDGVTLRFPWGDNRDYVEQARRNATSLSGFLAKATGTKVWVNPVLILPGWFVGTISKNLGNAVPVMPETRLVNYLRGLPHSLSDQQIQQIAFQIEQKCRDVEF